MDNIHFGIGQIQLVEKEKEKWNNFVKKIISNFLQMKLFYADGINFQVLTDFKNTDKSYTILQFHSMEKRFKNITYILFLLIQLWYLYDKNTFIYLLYFVDPSGASASQKKKNWYDFKNTNESYTILQFHSMEKRFKNITYLLFLLIQLWYLYDKNTFIYLLYFVAPTGASNSQKKNIYFFKSIKAVVKNTFNFFVRSYSVER